MRKDGAVTQSGNYNKELEIDYSKNNQESAQKAGLTILDGRVQSLVKNETVTASLNNSNDVEIYVKVVDNAGHETEATKDLKIDITHPTIAVTYDLNTPLNERYYKDVRTATVVVTERNFDESAVRFNITNTDGTQPAISGWTHSANAGVSDDATHTCQVTFAADGDYTFTLETTDLAGNASSYNRVDDFTIDRTVPTIQVSYDNNSAATPGYFNANRTATVTVNEHNFNAAEVNAQITAALQGSGVAAPGLGGWSTNGDVHTASVRGELKKTVEKRSDKDDKRFADFFQIIGRPGYSSEDSDVEKCGSVDETSTPYSLNRNEKVSSQRGDQTCTLVSLTAGSPIRLTVTKQEYVIGKSTEQADGVAGFSKMISRRHCKIVKRGSGYAVVDLNSSNGTYLNGMQLFPGREYPVKNGDIIRMAISDFQIVME